MAGAKLTKAEEIERMVAAAVDAGEERHLETVDFNDPNRPKTCLEVDFPILKINAVAGLEARSGAATKPIYQEMKWWARRQSSVFRSTLIAAAAKAPDDQAEAAKLVWENYYCNHQKNASFKNLKVADIFMGGGTTLVEGARLGMQMYGNDLNPVAWLVVKNELADVDIEEVKRLFAYIESEVKPQIMPFYACEGPGGEKGIWYSVDTGKPMPEDFDPLAVAPEERKKYRYEGPEIIYTFWAKHGPCSAPGCNHRTPLFSSPVIAVKELSVKSWPNNKCEACKEKFDIEAGEVRMAPDEPLIITEDEKPFATLKSNGSFDCPHCGKNQYSAAVNGKSKNKKVSLSLLIHPDWMKGVSGADSDGEFGGTTTSPASATKRWNIKRLEKLSLIEIRGKFDQESIKVDSGNVDLLFSTMPKNAHFVCQSDTCGREQKVLDSIRDSQQTGAVSPYALQCFSEKRKLGNYSYNGRYFKALSTKDIERLNSAAIEWELRSKTDLEGYWPKDAVPTDGLKTAELTNQNYDHWYKMFGARQLLVNSLLLKSICTATGFSEKTKLLVLGAFQQYLRSNCSFTIYHKKNDQASKVLSNNNFHSKNNLLDVPVFSDVGDGSWKSAIRMIEAALAWKENPWELVLKEHLDENFPEISKRITGQSQKIYPGDPLSIEGSVSCGSSSAISSWADLSFDMVITDPPFGNNINYAELADFFYPWMRIGTSAIIGNNPFVSELSPKALEAVTNPKRNPDDPDGFYRQLLTACWQEAARVLKKSGLLAFTFHHSEDEPWVDVLESLFNAGFYLEATYPIRSDQTKGDNAQYGSQKIEYDIIHVCRKRTEEPSEISWPKLRRQILRDVRQLQNLLEHHQQAGLPEADIEVIKRGKALEYFSRHYGKVYVEEGREFTVKEALAGINEIIQDQSGSDAVKAPDKAEPLTRQFLRIFADKEQIERDQMQKFLRGSGVGPSDFITRGWCKEINRPKAFVWVDALEFAKEKKSLKNLRRDLDQAIFLVGASYSGSGINVKKEMNDSDFKPHPALGELFNWLGMHGPTSEFRNASYTARQLFNSWSAANQQVMMRQLSLFDLAEEV
jgi:hypothetical protein